MEPVSRVHPHENMGVCRLIETFAGSAVVQHPNNPMITSILQCTQHLRPTNGRHHSSGISVAPIVTPQYPPLPLGPAAAAGTPVVTTPRKKQAKKLCAGVPAPVKVKLPFEEPLEVLKLREAAIIAKIKAGAPLSGAQVFADLMAIGQSRNYLTEKARLHIVGGRAADLLVERQKKMAEEVEAPDWWLLP